LGKRQESSDRTRAGVLAAARRMLESQGFLNFTLDGLAREGGVTRQTVHNLFGTKGGVIEALFDQLASSGGMERMPLVMQQTDARQMLDGFVQIFIGFWKKDRLLLRRIHGIAAIDPEFGAAVGARNQRRKGAAARVVGLLGQSGARRDTEQRVHALFALTSFEFYDALVEACGDEDLAARSLRAIVENAVLT
jgi:AcrR family transcriptional regulator